MAVYFDPGWGEQLKNALSGIGTGIRDIINPNFEQQKKLQAALADPKIAQEYANMASVNPNMLNNPVVGGRNAELIRQLKPSQQFQNQQTIQREVGSQLRNPTVRTDAARQVVGARSDEALAQDRLQVRNAEAITRINSLRANQAEQLQASIERLKATRPELDDLQAWREITGDRAATQEEWQMFKDKTDRYAQGKALAVKDPIKFLRGFANGEFSADELEAFYSYNPAAFRYAADLIEKEDGQKFQLRLRALMNSGGGESEWLHRMLVTKAVTEASQQNVNPNIIAAQWGITVPGMPPATPEEIEAYQKDQESARKNENRRVINSLNADINRLKGMFDKAQSESEKAYYAGLINQNIQERTRFGVPGAILTKPSGQSRLGMDWLKSDNNWQFTDAQGNILENQEAPLYMSDPPASGSGRQTNTTNTDTTGAAPTAPSGRPIRGTNETDDQYEARLKAYLGSGG